MHQTSRFVAPATAISLTICSAAALASGAGTAAADGARVVPLSGYLKRCDFSNVSGMPPAIRGSGYVVIARIGNTVSAETHLVDVAPDTAYGVRVVELPRPGIGCGAIDPGVVVGTLTTDGAGMGITTVQEDVMPGGTGVWVSVEGPVGDSQRQSGDFRTSDYVVSI
jgi:hypothetical protein